MAQLIKRTGLPIWYFSASRHDGPGQRWLKFHAFVTKIGKSAGELHVVYYGQVMSHSRVGQHQRDASHVYGGFIAHLEYCYELI